MYEQRKTRQITARLDAEHSAILDALCSHLRLRTTDVIQAALRAHARQLKVKVKRPGAGRKTRKG